MELGASFTCSTAEGFQGTRPARRKPPTITSGLETSSSSTEARRRGTTVYLDRAVVLLCCHLVTFLFRTSLRLFITVRSSGWVIWVQLSLNSQGWIWLALQNSAMAREMWGPHHP